MRASSAGPPPDRVVLRPDPGTGFVVIVFAVACLPLATSRTWLLPLLLVPAACIVWQRRARVVADNAGLTVCNGLRTERVAWEQVRGFDLAARGRVRLLRAGQEPTALTGLQRRDLPRLIAVGEQAARRSP